MPIGDSITEGGPSGGYRRKLFTERGRFLPVGSLSTDPPTVAFPAFPSDHCNHEGHNGFTTALILASIATYWAANPANFVTIHLGTNDALALTAAATTAANIASIIDYIHGQSPSTFIWLAGIINLKSTLVSENLLVDAQRPLVQALTTTRPWTAYIAMPHMPDANLDGTAHPVDAASYDLLADAWIAGIPP